jgi:dienelactone hydrolase
MKKLMVSIILLVFLSGCHIPPPLTTPMSLPEPTGKYGIGITSLPLIDFTRNEKFSKTSKPREIMVQLWYPTVKDLSGTASEYLDEVTANFMLKDKTAPPGLSPDFRLLIKTHSFKDAPLINDMQKFPVIVFSPGRGLIYQFYQSLLEDLASHGYIVAAINHPYISGVTVFPDLHYYQPVQAKNRRQFLTENFSTVVQDIKFVTDNLIKLNQDPGQKFYGKLDVSKIGCFGHSYGGGAAVQAGINYSEITAALDMDGSIWGEDYKRPVPKPILYLCNDLSRKTDPTTKKLWKNLSEGYIVQINKARHLNFSDYGIILTHIYPTIPRLFFAIGKIDPIVAIQITRESILHYFDIYLRGSSNEDLINIARQYPESKLEKKQYNE